MSFIEDIFNSRSKEDGNFLLSVQAILGFRPKNIGIYKRVFTHCSMNEKDKFGHDVNYERLEFLGDSLLGSIISCYLFKQSPQGDEGYLSKMRAKAVSRNNLNKIGKSFKLLDLLKSHVTPSSFNDNIYGNILEALIGAIYLDQGYKKCESFVIEKIVTPHICIEELENTVISYKSFMIEWCQKYKKSYKLVECQDNGQEKNGQKHFSMVFQIDGKTIARARETSKKKAEEKVSRRAYYALQDKIES